MVINYKTHKTALLYKYCNALKIAYPYFHTHTDAALDLYILYQIKASNFL